MGLGRLCSQLINFKCVIRGHSHIKVTGMLVGKFILNPQGSPMWMWLKLKLTPKRAFCVVRHRAFFFVNFFVQSTKRYPKWDQNLQFTPQNETTSIPVTFVWESPRGKVGELYEMNEVARSDETLTVSTILLIHCRFITLKASLKEAISSAKSLLIGWK